MNAKWIKANLTVVIAVGVFVVLMAALVWLQHRSWAQTSLIESDLEGKRSDLDRLLGAKPFPSRENVEVVRKDRERLVEQYQALTQTVSRSSIEVPEMRPVGFSQLMARVTDRLRRAASAASVKTPDNFAFGFDHYVATLPCRNLPEDQCKQVLELLVRQLMAVERLGELLIRNRVKEIKAIRRADVEPGGSGTESLTTPVNRDPNALYQTLPFEIEFVCNTESLRAFLNELSKSDWFFAVRTLKIDAESKGSTSGGPGSASASDRLIVTMRISLIEFPGAPKKEGS
jgi:hypothetical protein